MMNKRGGGENWLKPNLVVSILRMSVTKCMQKDKIIDLWMADQNFLLRFKLELF